MIMIFYSLYHIFLIIGFAKGECSSESCAGHFELTHSTHRRLNITGKTFMARVSEIKPTITGYILTWRRYINYEYEGGALDSNSGCNSKYDYPEMTTEEAEKWTNKGKCRIGTVCPPNSDCWGSGATPCLEPYVSRLKAWVDSKEADHFGKCWYLFAHHTCVLDWACNVKKFDFPLTFRDSNTFSTSLQNGTVVPILFKNNLIDLGRGMYLYIRSQDVEKIMIREYCQVNCIFPEQLEKSVCSTASSCRIPHVPMKYIKDKKFCARYICAEVEYKIEDKTVKAPSDRAASITDLEETRTYLTAEVERIDLNSANLMNHIDEIETILIRLINHAAKTDPLLLSEILKINFMTRHMNDKQFTLCPCSTAVPSNEEICNSKKEKSFIFKGGFYKEWNKKETCFRPTINATGTVKNLNLISNFEVHQDNFVPPDIVGADFTWEGWQWLSKYQDDIEWTINQNKGEAVSSFFDGLNNYPFLNFPGPLFTFISSYAGWLSLIMSICIICCKK